MKPNLVPLMHAGFASASSEPANGRSPERSHPMTHLQRLSAALLLSVGSIVSSAAGGPELTPEIHVSLTHTANITSVAFSPDGQLIATGSRDETAKLWDAASGVVLRTLHGHAGTVADVAFSPDGRLLVCADAALRVWEVAGGKQIRVLEGKWESEQRIAFSPDGRVLAQACKFGIYNGQPLPKE